MGLLQQQKKLVKSKSKVDLKFSFLSGWWKKLGLLQLQSDKHSKNPHQAKELVIESLLSWLWFDCTSNQRILSGTIPYVFFGWLVVYKYGYLRLYKYSI